MTSLRRQNEHLTELLERENAANVDLQAKLWEAIRSNNDAIARVDVWRTSFQNVSIELSKAYRKYEDEYSIAWGKIERLVPSVRTFDGGKGKPWEP